MSVWTCDGCMENCVVIIGSKPLDRCILFNSDAYKTIWTKVR